MLLLNFKDESFNDDILNKVTYYVVKYHKRFYLSLLDIN